MEKEIFKQNDKNVVSRNTDAGRSFFQPKLSVNQADDVYELEADHVADKVMKMADPSADHVPFFKSGSDIKQGETMVGGSIQPKQDADNAIQGNHTLDNYAGTLSSSGQPLPDADRKFFEQRMGHDFSNVKLHTDEAAAQSAQSINALAYTTGNNIVFNTGQYSPGTDSGKKLMAHELAHVVQQENINEHKIQRKIEVPEGLKLDTAGFNSSKAGNVYSCPLVVKNSSVLVEIFTSMLASPRVFKPSGGTNNEINLNVKKHIAARLGIIDFASHKQYKFGAGAATKMNKEFFKWNAKNWDYIDKDPVKQEKAARDLNENPQLYTIGCKAATELTMDGGSNSPVKFKDSPDVKDWIPGDAGYIENQNFTQFNTPGNEGENIIYVGKDKFWGHYESRNDYYTLEEWEKEVNSFDKDHGKANLTNQRGNPSAGLEDD